LHLDHLNPTAEAVGYRTSRFGVEQSVKSVPSVRIRDSDKGLPDSPKGGGFTRQCGALAGVIQTKKKNNPAGVEYE